MKLEEINAQEMECSPDPRGGKIDCKIRDRDTKQIHPRIIENIQIGLGVISNDPRVSSTSMTMHTLGTEYREIISEREPFDFEIKTYFNKNTWCSVSPSFLNCRIK